MGRELLVVVPAFNKGQHIDSFLQEWTTELDRSGVDYGLLLLDRGSTDRTPAIMERWVAGRADGRFLIYRHDNISHGQTCLEGYRRACWSGAPWVLQIDSDGQCDSSYFRAIWERRQGNQVVYGCRTQEHNGWMRAFSSASVRGLVKIAAGVDCVDANVPYRLMSTAGLLPIVDTVPSGFGLANIALAVQIKRAGWRETTVPMVFRPRTGDEPAVPFVRFAGKAFELLGQLLLLPRPVLRGAP